MQHIEVENTLHDPALTMLECVQKEMKARTPQTKSPAGSVKKCQNIPSCIRA
jgi:hypothetical protein